MRIFRSKFLSFYIIVLGLLFMALASASDCTAQSSKTVEKVIVRKLVFPTQFSLGRLYVLKKKKNTLFFPTGKRVAETFGRFVGEAKGDVVFKAPDDSVVYLIASYQLTEKPEVLTKLDPNVIDCLSFGGTGIMADLTKTIKPLSHLTGLRFLELSMAELTDQSLVDLKTLVNLERLDLFMAGINGTCFRELSSLKKLHTLDINSNVLEEKVYGYLSKMQSLECLHLNRCGVKDHNLAEIAKLQKLNALSLSQNLITAKSISYINQMKELRFLALTNTKLSTRDLLTLKANKLKTLNLPAVSYSPADLALIQKVLPNTRLVCQGIKVSDYEKTLYGPLH